MLPAPAELPAAVLAALVAREGLGDLHPVLASVPVWRDGGDPALDQLDHHLTSLGWLDRYGELEREISSSLAVLCRPDVSYYGWLTHDSDTIAVLAAAIGRKGVLAIRTADAIRLRSVSPRDLAALLIAQLPEMQPGPGAPMCVSLSELRATDRRGRQRTRDGVVQRLSRPEVRRAQEMLALPTTGAGELYVGSNPTPLCYIDTAVGRYAVATINPDTVRVVPGAGLVAQLDGIRLGA